VKVEKGGNPMIKSILKKLSSLTRRKLRIVGVNIPIVFFLMAGLSILPIGMAFGEDGAEPAGNNISGQVQIFDVEFHPGGTDGSSPIPNLEYPDSTPIENGDFWLSFNWRLLEEEGSVAYGDYFDVTIDLGLETIPAIIKAQQQTTVAPIIYLGDYTAVGSISWINTQTYETDNRIIIRVALDAASFNGIQGSPEDPVRGRGVWGFNYKAGSEAGESEVLWQVDIAESDDPPSGGVIVKPKPENPNVKNGGNDKNNPYDEHEYGYRKAGGRITPTTTPFADTLFYWSVQINGHKHQSFEEWKNCKNNTDKNLYNDDPPPVPINEDGSYPATFTIVDTGRNTAPTWLREVTEFNGNPIVHQDTPIQVDANGGFYGQSLGATGGPAYFKLFYVNSETIWNDRIDFPGTEYATPANDENPKHQPEYGKDVGEYDPYYTTRYLKEGERSALMYAPNGSEPGGVYGGYLTPVPRSDIVRIEMTPNGFKIEMVSDAILGKTLVIGCMAKPATDSLGNFSNDVGNSVSIMGVRDGDPLASVSGNVLIAGTIEGSRASPNKGSFVIDKRAFNTAERMEGVAFNVVASSENEELASLANELIAEQKNMNDPPGLRTDSDGKLSVKLPDLPWSGGKNLVLTITETAPDEHFAVKPFTVEFEPENGTIVSLVPGQGESHLVKLASDKYGVEVWNRSTVKDMSIYDAALLKWIKKVDRPINGDLVNIYYDNEVNENVVSVKNGDLVLYRIDVYNHCYNPLTITKILDDIPAGLVFEPGLRIPHVDPEKGDYTNEGLWRLWEENNTDKTIIEYIGPALHLEPWSGEIGNYPEGRLPLVLKVAVPDNMPDGTAIKNVAWIKEMLNSDGEDVTDQDPTPWNNIDDAVVTPNNEIILSCEVDKDTIRRTSAAYVSPEGREGFDNLEDKETYRYDVNFRSTSNIAADEFVLDDPLECVKEGLVQLEMLVTPIVWGDVDGLYNLWYKTNLTIDGRVYDDKTAVEEGVTQMWKNDGYRLWREKLSTTQRYQLFVKDLGLEEGEYVTALRFEYGAVVVGFTSKNYSSKSLNGEHRDADGELTLPPEDLAKLDDLTTKAAKPIQASAVPASAPITPASEQDGGNIFTKLFGGLFGPKETYEDPPGYTADMYTAEQIATFSIGGPYDPILPGGIVNWTPDPSRPDYAPGAAGATGLAPVSYLVSATKPMSDVSIVSSAASRIAKGSLWGEDIDAVKTLQLTTFYQNPDEGMGLNRWNAFSDNIPRLKPDTLGTIGRSARTSDDMKPLLWIITALAAAFSSLLLIRLYNLRKRRLLRVQKRRRYAR